MLKPTVIYRTISLLIIVMISGLIGVYGEADPLEHEGRASFVVFYDHIDADAMAILSQYDMAIVESKGVQPGQVQALQQGQTQVYAYMSTLQVEADDAYKMDRTRPDDFLYDQGQRVLLENYGDPIGDISQPHFRSVLISTIEERVVRAGYDGVFLDTVGCTESFDDPALNEKLQQGYIEFLGLLKDKFPDLKIIQNRGFKVFKAGSYAYLDYLMYENFSYETLTSGAYYETLVDDINAICSSNPVQVLALAKGEKQVNEAFAKALGWSFYYSNYGSHFSELNQDVMVKAEEALMATGHRQAYTLMDLDLTKDMALERIKMFLLDPKYVEMYDLDKAIVTDARGQPVMVYGDHMMDMAHPAYQAYVLKTFKAKRAQGYTNFKLAYVTACNKLAEGASVTRRSQVRAYQDFLRGLKTYDPAIGLYQIRGFDLLSQELLGLLDGYYWDNFKYDALATSRSLQNKVDLLVGYQKKYKWTIIFK